MSWNFQGLNDKDKRNEIKKTIKIECPYILTLQETKWNTLNIQFIRQTLPARYSGYIQLQAVNSACGILLAWNDNVFHETTHHTGRYTITNDFTNVLDAFKIRFTVVYRPTVQLDRSDIF
jgi:exonuclease III